MAAALAAAKTTTMAAAKPTALESTRTTALESTRTAALESTRTAAEVSPSGMVCAEAAPVEATSRAEIIPTRFAEAAGRGLAVERLH